MQFVCIFLHICRKLEFVISQGSVATRLKLGRQCRLCVVANFIRVPALQEFWKSVKIWQRYRQLNGVNVLRHSVLPPSKPANDYISWNSSRERGFLPTTCAFLGHNNLPCSPKLPPVWRFGITRSHAEQLESIQKRAIHNIMDALFNRCGHYIFVQWFFYLQSSIFYLLSIFFSAPNLSHRRLDVYHTSTHDVALVQI